MSSLSLTSSVKPFATILALTVLPFCRRTQRDLITLLRCSLLRLLKCVSVYTCCDFIDLISCFMPSIVCALSRPSVLVTQGSRRIFSVLCSCSSSLDTALMFSPFRVFTVTAETLILVAAGSCMLSGRCVAVVCSSVFCCFAALPSDISSVTSLFAGVGRGVFFCCVVGAVAMGRSIIVLDGVVIAVVGVDSRCSGCRCVCVSALVVDVVCCLCCVALAFGMSTKPVPANVVQGVELMMSIIWVLYLSGLTCLLMVLDLITLLGMPSMFSFVDVSLPSQIAGKNLACIFGMFLTVGNM